MPVIFAMHAYAMLVLIVITGPPNGPVLFSSLSSVVDFVVCLSALSSSVGVCNAASGRAGRARRRSARWPLGASVVGRPTLNGGPVRLCPVRATRC